MDRYWNGLEVRHGTGPDSRFKHVHLIDMDSEDRLFQISGLAEAPIEYSLE